MEDSLNASGNLSRKVIAVAAGEAHTLALTGDLYMNRFMLKIWLHPLKIMENCWSLCGLQEMGTCIHGEEECLGDLGPVRNRMSFSQFESTLILVMSLKRKGSSLWELLLVLITVWLLQVSFPNLCFSPPFLCWKWKKNFKCFHQSADPMVEFFCSVYCYTHGFTIYCLRSHKWTCIIVACVIVVWYL